MISFLKLTADFCARIWRRPIREHDTVSLPGTVVHIYASGKVMEVEIQTSDGQTTVTVLRHQIKQ